MSEQFTLIGEEGEGSGPGSKRSGSVQPGASVDAAIDTTADTPKDPPADATFAAPLADRMRPQSLEQFFGQTHLLGETSTLRSAIEKQLLHSMVFWGPPGTGKTTLARIIAAQCDANFISVSAVLSGVKDIRAAVDLSLIHI